MKIASEFFSLPTVDGVLGIVADGHGGSEISNLLVKELPELILKSSAYNRGDIPAALKGALEKIERYCSENMPSNHIAGSCVTAFVLSSQYFSQLLVSPRTITVAWVGDCEAVLFHGSQFEPMFVSSAHRPSNPSEKQRITDTGGWISENGRVFGALAVSRSIGDNAVRSMAVAQGAKDSLTATPEIFTVAVPHDARCLVVGSDGLWDVIPPDSVSEILRHLFVTSLQRGVPLDPNLLSQKLIAAVGRKALDDVTVLVTLLGN